MHSSVVLKELLHLCLKSVGLFLFIQFLDELVAIVQKLRCVQFVLLFRYAHQKKLVEVSVGLWIRRVAGAVLLVFLIVENHRGLVKRTLRFLLL